MKFSVRYDVRGSFEEVIEAESIEDAKRIADDKIADEDWIPELDTAEDIRRHITRMHHVRRDGKTMYVGWVSPTDERLEVEAA